MVVATSEQKFQGIGQLLVLEKILTKPKAMDCFKLAASENLSLLQYLVKYQILCPKLIASTLSRNFGLPILDLRCMDPQSIPIEAVDEELIRRHFMLPLFKGNNLLYLATDDPSNQNAFKEIQFHTGLRPSAILVQTDELSYFINHLLTNKAQNTYRTNDLSQFEPSDSPVVESLNRILQDAVERGISDIHFEPYDTTYRIRYRQDGLLREIVSPPAELASQITARLKIMSNLDIAEKRVPQDGGFKMKLSNSHSIDFRVSACPTIGGEKIVVRLLDPLTSKLSLDSLGFNPHQLDLFLKAIKRPQGMILVTGPTGSGKTMTLYRALDILNTIEVNISTVEDPVEIKVQGINQVSINPKAGLTFAASLRAFLRQDPDVILVGEIRDYETAEIAIKASQTGHLVLSSLHTNSAAETLNRLLHMGVSAFNLTSSLHLIVAQRLARKLCEHCKALRTDLTADDLMALGYQTCELTHIQLHQAMGCDHCNQGYKGRIGLFEILPMTKTIVQIILSGGNALDVLKTAQMEGMLTLYQSGLEKVKLGLTTLEEINRVTID